MKRAAEESGNLTTAARNTLESASMGYYMPGALIISRMGECEQMKRDIEKAIETGKQIMKNRPGLDLSLDEILEIRDRQDQNGPDSVMDAIYDAYAAGLAVGQRNS